MSKQTKKNAKKVDQIITTKSLTRLKRTYSLNGIEMYATLRDDIPDEMETWLKLMDQCKKDLTKRIQELNK